jgi:ketosteroid isomerase-like protein
MGELNDFLSTVIPRQEQADLALHNGDPEPRFELYSHEDPVTVLGALGLAASGWDDVAEVFRSIANRFSRCERFELEIVAAEVSGDLAYTVGYENSRFSIDGGPVGPGRLRVTHAYRRENGEWKIVHRHGDPLKDDPPPA